MTMKYEPIIKPGTHLASAKNDAEAFLGALLDDETNKVVGQARWKLSTENRTADALLWGILGATLGVVGTKAAPYVRMFWQGTIEPGVKKLWAKIMKKDDTSGENLMRSPAIITEGVTQQLDEAYKNYRIQMDSEDAERELVEIFLIAALLVSKINKLSHAEIADGLNGTLLAGQRIVEMLSSPQFLGNINKILENNPNLLEENQCATMEALFGKVFTKDREYIPIETETLRNALALDSNHRIETE